MDLLPQTPLAAKTESVKGLVGSGTRAPPLQWSPKDVGMSLPCHPQALLTLTTQAECPHCHCSFFAPLGTATAHAEEMQWSTPHHQGITSAGADAPSNRGSPPAAESAETAKTLNLDSPPAPSDGAAVTAQAPQLATGDPIRALQEQVKQLVAVVARQEEQLADIIAAFKNSSSSDDQQHKKTGVSTATPPKASSNASFTQVMSEVPGWPQTTHTSQFDVSASSMSMPTERSTTKAGNYISAYSMASQDAALSSRNNTRTSQYNIEVDCDRDDTRAGITAAARRGNTYSRGRPMNMSINLSTASAGSLLDGYISAESKEYMRSLGLI